MAIAATNNAPAVMERKGELIRIMAAQVNLDPNVYANTIKATCFPDGKATNEQLAAFLVVAKQYDLNPLTKEIHAFPGKGGGVVPMVGIDGWLNLGNRNPQMDGMELTDNEDANGNLVSCTCTIWRKDRKMPFVVTERLAECKRNTEPWNQRPRRMLRHKATIQGMRYTFGYAGIADPDDYDMPIEAVLIDETEAIEAKPSMPQAKGETPAEVSDFTKEFYRRADVLGIDHDALNKQCMVLFKKPAHKIDSEDACDKVLAALQA